MYCQINGLDFTYEEAQYTAQLAIWKTLIGKSGNEPEDGWKRVVQRRLAFS